MIGIIHQHSPVLQKFEALFAPIKSASVVAAPDNDISLQGLLDKEVVIVLPEMEGYTARCYSRQGVCEGG